MKASSMGPCRPGFLRRVSVSRVGDVLPFVAVFAEMGRPGTIGGSGGPFKGWLFSHYAIRGQKIDLRTPSEGTPARFHVQRNGSDISRPNDDSIREYCWYIHTNNGRFPVSFQPLHGNPMHARITQGPGCESEAMWEWIAPLGDDAVDAAIDFHLGGGGVVMADVLAEDVHQRQADLVHGHRHDVGRLLLRILGAAVGDRRTLIKIDRPVVAIVPVQQLLLIPGRFEFFLLELGEKVRRLGKARPRRRRGPAPGMMDREVPAGRSAHREAAHGDAVVVDRIMLLDVLQGLEGVDFAGEMVGVAVAAIRMQHEGVGRREPAGILQAIVEEIQLGQRFASAMKPDVQPMRMAPYRPDTMPAPPGHKAAPSRRCASGSRARPGRFRVVQSGLPVRSCSARSRPILSMLRAAITSGCLPVLS